MLLLAKRNLPTWIIRLRILKSFLKKENGELKRLVAFAGITDVSIDFAISTPPANIVVWTRRFPAGLLAVIGSLGTNLDFTIYPESH